MAHPAEEEKTVADTYVVERSMTINASPADLYERISNFRNWAEWSPWEDLDPDMQQNYHGDDGTVGSGYSWKGNRKAGQGRMRISDLEAPDRVTIDLQFEKPFKSQSVTEFALNPDGDGTNVTWKLTGTHNWMSKVMGIFMSMDKTLGKDFEKGLQNLKSVSES